MNVELKMRPAATRLAIAGRDVLHIAKDNAASVYGA